MKVEELKTAHGANAVGLDDHTIVVTIPEGYKLVARVESGRIDVLPMARAADIARGHVAEFVLKPAIEGHPAPPKALALVRKDERPGRWAALWAAVVGLFRRRA